MTEHFPFAAVGLLLRRRRARRFSVAPLMALFACAAPSHARAQRSSGTLLDSVETFLDRVPVASPGVRVGVVASAKLGAVKPGFLVVDLIANGSPNLCVEVTSRDGRYRASYAYDIRDVPSGLQSVRTPTRFADALSMYMKEDLAVLASVGPSCSTKPTGYLVAAWDAPARDDSITVLLNSRVPTSLIVGQGAVVDRIVSCRPIVGERTAFNLRCVISPNWLVGNAQVFVRQRSGESVQQLPLLILRRQAGS